MKTYKFSSVDNLLKLDAGLSPDKDGDVSVKAEQMETINNHIETLAADVAAKDKTITDNAKEIADLKEQVKNLKDGPGAETTDIEDDGVKDEISASTMFNSIKHLL